MKYKATSVLWTKVWTTKATTNESRFKDLLKALITTDVNAGKLDYSEMEILDMFEYAYGRSGSTNPKVKARHAWTRYAKPGKENWFV